MCSFICTFKAAFVGKDLTDPQTLTDVMNSLDREVNPDEAVGLASADYRKHLAKAVVYKVICYN